MKRFETAQHPVLYWAIALAVATVFIIDVRTPIGISTWLLYLLPILLCFLVPKRWLPLLVAGVSTVLMVADWFLSPPTPREPVVRMALINRALGLICIWATAILESNVLSTRIQLREQDWLRTARAR